MGQVSAGLGSDRFPATAVMAVPRVIAKRFQSAAYDVIAAADDSAGATLPDQERIRVAAGQGRAVVTENVHDLDRIVRAWAPGGEHHGWPCAHLATSVPPGKPVLSEEPGGSASAAPGRPQLPSRDGIFWLP